MKMTGSPLRNGSDSEKDLGKPSTLRYMGTKMLLRNVSADLGHPCSKCCLQTLLRSVVQNVQIEIQVNPFLIRPLRSDSRICREKQPSAVPAANNRRFSSAPILHLMPTDFSTGSSITVGGLGVLFSTFSNTSLIITMRIWLCANFSCANTFSPKGLSTTFCGFGMHFRTHSITSFTISGFRLHTALVTTVVPRCPVVSSACQRSGPGPGNSINSYPTEEYCAIVTSRPHHS